MSIDLWNNLVSAEIYKKLLDDPIANYWGWDERQMAICQISLISRLPISTIWIDRDTILPKPAYIYHYLYD